MTFRCCNWSKKFSFQHFFAKQNLKKYISKIFQWTCQHLMLFLLQKIASHFEERNVQNKTEITTWARVQNISLSLTKYIHTHTLTSTHKHTHTHTHTHKHTQTHGHTHTYTHAHTLTSTHKHTHTQRVREKERYVTNNFKMHSS